MNFSQPTLLSFFLIVTVIFSVISSRTATASESENNNLLINSGFEDPDITHWKGNADFTATDARTGSNSLALTGDPVAYAYTSILVTAMSTYRFSGWLKVIGLSRGHFTYRVSWYDAGGLEITDETRYFGKVSANINYFQSYLDQVAPEKAKSVKLFLIADNSDGIGYFDDLDITDISVDQESTQTILVPLNEIATVTEVSVTANVIPEAVIDETDNSIASDAGIAEDLQTTPDNTLSNSTVTDTMLIANSDSIFVELNKSLSFNLLANDAGNIAGTLVKLISQPVSGQIFLAHNGDAVYTPNTDFTGYDSFLYQIENRNGDISIATVSVRITCAGICDKLFQLNWTPSTSAGVVGYKIFVGRSAGIFNQAFNVANVNQFTYKAVEKGSYYFSVKAISDSNLESAFSEVLSVVN